MLFLGRETVAPLEGNNKRRWQTKSHFEMKNALNQSMNNKCPIVATFETGTWNFKVVNGENLAGRFLGERNEFIM